MNELNHFYESDLFEKILSFLNLNKDQFIQLLKENLPADHPIFNQLQGKQQIDVREELKKMKQLYGENHPIIKWIEGEI